MKFTSTILEKNIIKGFNYIFHDEMDGVRKRMRVEGEEGTFPD